MSKLSQIWHDNPVARYFAGLDRCDQATFIIVVALAFAIGVASSAIMLSRESEAMSEPRLTAPPFDLGFAAAAGTRS